jgi:hypothetical protein
MFLPVLTSINPNLLLAGSMLFKCVCHKKRERDFSLAVL